MTDREDCHNNIVLRNLSESSTLTTNHTAHDADSYKQHDVVKPQVGEDPKSEGDASVHHIGPDGCYQKHDSDQGINFDHEPLSISVITKSWNNV